MRRTQTKTNVLLQAKLASILLLVFFFTNCQEKKASLEGYKQMEWSLLHFNKVDSLNPILQPSSTQVFDCSLSNGTVMWEEKNVLNPSGVVREGKVYLVYRAQDKK
jgi:hypothetical protein